MANRSNSPPSDTNTVHVICTKAGVQPCTERRKCAHVTIEEDPAKRATTPSSYKELVVGLATAAILLIMVTIMAVWAFKKYGTGWGS